MTGLPFTPSGPACPHCLTDPALAAAVAAADLLLVTDPAAPAAPGYVAVRPARDWPADAAPRVLAVTAPWADVSAAVRPGGDPVPPPPPAAAPLDSRLAGLLDAAPATAAH